MKSKVLCFFLVAAVLLSTVNAIEWDGKFGLGLRGQLLSPLFEGSSYSRFSGNEPFMMGYSGELDIKYGLSKSLAIGVTAGYGLTYDHPYNSKDQSFNEIFNKTDNNNTKLNGMLLSLEGYYHFFPDKYVQPYVLAGAGMDMWKMTTQEASTSFSAWPAETEYSFTDLSAKLGAGLNIWLGEHWTFDLQGKFSLFLSNLSADDDTIYYGDMSEKSQRAFTAYFQPSIGISYYFGGRKDTDKDGVDDKADKCPDTPLGAVVDAAGCPLDSDGDGVYDGLDKCLDTPRGAKVDITGCPIDSDGDGVYDGLDKCADTPANSKVDNVGCPIDTDKDGVPDYRDKQINTPAGVIVDNDGVGKDTDKDGVYDGLDRCPTTAAGVQVDKFGCPVEVKQPVEKITLNIKYATGSYEPDQPAKQTLDDLASTMKAYVDYRIEIDGFTDDVGGEQANLTLSQKRADAVMQYLLNQGIEADRMVAKGFGENPDYAIGDNTTPEGRQMNRRVEIISVNQ